MDARDVIIATNGYSGGLSKAIQRAFVPIGSYMIATEPLPAAVAVSLLPNRRVAFDSKHFLYYFRVDGDRLLFGGRAEFTGGDATSARRAGDILRAGMVDVFPQLAGVAVEYVWGGRVAFTRDQVPHGGRLDDGTSFAGGYCGHGIAMATDLGDALARRLCGETVSHPFLDDRCPAVPFYNGTPWFLPLVGGYYRVKDWAS